jgi:hypothetical protein
MTKKQAEGLRLSIERFGFAVPFLVSPDGDIYDGHQRQALMGAIKQYGPNATVDVRVSSRQLTDDERRELVVRLKQNQAGWDFDMLPNLYDKEELLEWGFEPEELGMFPADDMADDPGAQVDKAAELQAKWGTATGQLWQLGEHRLICGDCTDSQVVARVMDGERARLVFTSPPYADQREYELGKFDWLALANGEPWWLHHRHLHQSLKPLAEISLGHAPLEFTVHHEIGMHIAHHQVGGPAHAFFGGVLGQQNPTVAAVGVGVLQQHAHKGEPQFFSHLGVVVAHAMAGATVLRAEFDNGEGGHGDCERLLAAMVSSQGYGPPIATGPSRHPSTTLGIQTLGAQLA